MNKSVLQDYASRLRSAQEFKEQAQERVDSVDLKVKNLEVALLDAKMELNTAMGHRNAASDSVYVLKGAMKELINVA